MKILSIETSCDETAISILEFQKKGEKIYIDVISNEISSQIDLHKEYGGVYPTIAKREHIKNLPILLKKILIDANLYSDKREFSNKTKEDVKEIFIRNPESADIILKDIPSDAQIDAIAVTNGPGLIPALWTGVNIANALAKMWNKPIIPVNHMMGHIFSAIVKENGNGYKMEKPDFPIISLLVSGGHTELVLMESYSKYTKLGQTRDDAVGESFDKVAILLGLTYPGGPKISNLADKESHSKGKYCFPRPMINSNDFDFSFSGLKTAVLYKVNELATKGIPEDERINIAKEFQNAVVDVLIKKTKKAIDEYIPNGILLGGGVSANNKLRKEMELLAKEYNIDIHLPPKNLSTDNSIMIGIAAFIQTIDNNPYKDQVEANANLSI